MRVKIKHKMPLAYQKTVGGLKELLRKIELNKIPDEATIDWREWNIAELLWSAEDDIPRPNSEG